MPVAQHPARLCLRLRVALRGGGTGGTMRLPFKRMCLCVIDGSKRRKRRAGLRFGQRSRRGLLTNLFLAILKSCEQGGLRCEVLKGQSWLRCPATERSGVRLS